MALVGMRNWVNEGCRGCGCEEGKLFNGCEVPSWLEGVRIAFSFRRNLLNIRLVVCTSMSVLSDPLLRERIHLVKVAINVEMPSISVRNKLVSFM